MSITELVKAAKKQHPADELVHIRKYEDKYIFYFQTPGLPGDQQKTDNFTTLDSNGKWTPLNVWDWKVWEKTVEVPESEWKSAEHVDLEYGGYLEHYGRLGMKWYKHIFGDEDSRAKYNSSEKSESTSSTKAGMGARLDSMRRFNEKDDMQWTPSWSNKPQWDFNFNSVNPHFNEGPEYQNNCWACTTAWELKSRGYDVHATPSLTGRNVHQVAKFFKGGDDQVVVNRWYHEKPDGTREYDDELSRSKFNDWMMSFPAGSRLNLNFCRAGLGGHCVVGEKTETGIKIYDGQTGKQWDNATYKHWLNWGNEFSGFRMDNLEINDDTIDEAIEDWDWRKERQHSAFDIGDFLEHMEGGKHMTEWEARQDELEHYGRLGMKWYQHKFGDEDGRAKYINKVKSKELKKVSKKYSRPIDKEQQYADKQVKKFAEFTKNKLLDNPDEPTIVVGQGKEKKYLDRAGKALHRKQGMEELRDKEIETVKNMSWDDLMNEQKNVRKWAAARGVMYSMLGVVSVTGGIAAVPNLSDTADKYKTRMRTGRNFDKTRVYGSDYDKRR